ncbi:hypothetical protein A2U01_0057446, partial [Trifolium medium]|nr:hypothetical protein [Trifolium medium]
GSHDHRNIVTVDETNPVVTGGAPSVAVDFAGIAVTD